MRRSLRDKPGERPLRRVRYFAAKQREGDKRWDYTCSQDDQSWAVGYCAGWDEESNVDDPDLVDLIEEHLKKLRPFQARYHTKGHETKAEALDCYRDYLINHKVLWLTDEGVKRRCDANECDNWTHNYAKANGRVLKLCDKHRNKETLREVFTIPEDIWES